MLKHVLKIGVCYLAISGTTMLDSFNSGTPSGILDRFSSLPLTLGAAPLLIYVTILLLNSSSNEINTHNI